MWKIVLNIQQELSQIWEFRGIFGKKFVNILIFLLHLILQFHDFLLCEVVNLIRIELEVVILRFEGLAHWINFSILIELIRFNLIKIFALSLVSCCLWLFMSLCVFIEYYNFLLFLQSLLLVLLINFFDFFDLGKCLVHGSTLHRHLLEHLLDPISGLLKFSFEPFADLQSIILLFIEFLRKILLKIVKHFCKFIDSLLHLVLFLCHFSCLNIIFRLTQCEIWCSCFFQLIDFYKKLCME